MAGYDRRQKWLILDTSLQLLTIWKILNSWKFLLLSLDPTPRMRLSCCFRSCVRGVMLLCCDKFHGLLVKCIWSYTDNPKFQDQKGARKNCDLFFSPREVLSVPTACPLIYDNEWQASGRRPPYQPPALTANPKTNKQTHIALASTRKT